MSSRASYSRRRFHEQNYNALVKRSRETSIIQSQYQISAVLGKFAKPQEMDKIIDIADPRAIELTNHGKDLRLNFTDSLPATHTVFMEGSHAVKPENIP